MQLPKELTTVTPLSKAVALIMFISLPIAAFVFGMQYQILLTDTNRIVDTPTSIPIGCTKEAKICPDGSAVGRLWPKCEFEKCPAVQLKENTFIGPISHISYDCHRDGKCSIGVGKAEVIVEKGGDMPPGISEPHGTYPKDLLNEGREIFYLGKTVEIYAVSPDGKTDSYTLYGSKDYYIKLIDEVAVAPSLFCGGIAGKICPTGYDCKYDGTYPDVGGTCIKAGEKVKYIINSP